MNRREESKAPLLLAMLLGAALPFCLPSQAAGFSSPMSRPSVAGSEYGAALQASPTAANIFRDGVQAMQAGHLNEAEQDFQRVINLDPHSSAAYINLAVAYMREKRWSSALDQLHKADALSPCSAGIKLNLGLVYYRQNEFAQAVEPLKAALQLSPTSLQARYLLGLCYFFTGSYGDADATLDPLWSEESGSLNYLYVLSIAASKSGDAKLQKQAFDTMLAIGQDKPEFHLYLGKAWLAQDDTSNALKEFHLAEASYPNLPLVHYFLGRAYLKEHDYPHAEAEFLEDISVEPEVASNYEDLGTVSAQLNKDDDARRYYQLAVDHDPTLVNSYLGLAKLDRKTGQEHQALVLLDHAVLLAPRSASVHYMRAQVLAKLHDAQASREFAAASELLKSYNEHLQQDPSGDSLVDAQSAAQ